MPEIECPGCHSRLKIAEGLAGTTRRCPKCKTPVAIPGNPDDRVAEEQKPLFAQFRLPVPEPSTSAKRGRIGLFAVGIVVVIGVTAGLTVWATGRFRRGGGGDANDPELGKVVQRKPAENPNASKPAPGKLAKVRLTVTWKYNEALGSRADTGALVLLIPANTKHKVPSKLLESKVSDDAHFGHVYDLKHDGLKKLGIHAGLIGGDGKLVLNRIPEGRFTLVILSNNTADPSETEQERRLQDIFEVPPTFVNKAYLTDIDVLSGEDLELTHDFGLSAI